MRRDYPDYELAVEEDREPAEREEGRTWELGGPQHWLGAALVATVMLYSLSKRLNEVLQRKRGRGGVGSAGAIC